MNIVKNIFLIVTLVTVVNAEQSVYSDTDFIDPEVVAKKNSREIFILKQKISQLKESIEGLKTIINGQNNQIEQLRLKANASDNLTKIINQLSQRVAALESRPKEVVKEAATAPITPVETQAPVSSGTTAKKMTSKELYKKAVLNFTKSKLSSAQDIFKKLLKKGYKKASTNFYLGEIAYKRGRYKEAISYYQKSASLNENASYMDKLLLHTAISLKKKGKVSDAKVFLKAVIDGYPNTNSAKEAKKYLK